MDSDAEKCNVPGRWSNFFKKPTKMCGMKKSRKMLLVQHRYTYSYVSKSLLIYTRRFALLPQIDHASASADATPE